MRSSAKEGTKGGSEAGNVGARAAIVNAIVDALSPWGILEIALPAKPERVWRALREAARSADQSASVSGAKISSGL
jgi:carbon-monoxide dehydrogenase large subunit